MLRRWRSGERARLARWRRRLAFANFGLSECSAGKTVAAGVSPAICMPRRICNAEPRLLFYFFLRDSMTPSAMHSHLPLRSIQVSTQT